MHTTNTPTGSSNSNNNTSSLADTLSSTGGQQRGSLGKYEYSENQLDEPRDNVRGSVSGCSPLYSILTAPSDTLRVPIYHTPSSRAQRHRYRLHHPSLSPPFPYSIHNYIFSMNDAHCKTVWNWSLFRTWQKRSLERSLWNRPWNSPGASSSNSHFIQSIYTDDFFDIRRLLVQASEVASLLLPLNKV